MNVSKWVLVRLAASMCLGTLWAYPAAAQVADLKVVTSVTPASPKVGSRLTYTHTVSFVSGTSATNVTLTDMLPPGTTFDAPGSDVRCSVDACGTTVVCSLGPLSGSTSVAVAVTPSVAASITNVAGVAADQFDPAMTNNTSVSTSTVTPAPTFCISGVITSGGGGVKGVVVTAGGKTATTPDSGAYSICGLAKNLDGYSVTPTHGGYTFSPPSVNVILDVSNATGINFTATARSFKILGRVMLGISGLGNVKVTGCSTFVLTNAEGYFAIPGCKYGQTYLVEPSHSSYSFTPTRLSVTVPAENVTIGNFTALTYSISGTVKEGDAGLIGVVVTAGSKTATTAQAGAYAITGLSNGTYTVTPSWPGHSYTFTLPNRSVTIAGASVSGINFTGVPFAVSTVVPNDGPMAGGTVVTINGSGFLTGATVKFDTVESPLVTFVNSTTIRATSPARPQAGFVPITVTNLGGAATTFPNAFNYLGALTNRFYPVTPCRAVDTRNANGLLGGPALSGGTQRDFDFRGLCGIPGNARALELNFTVVGPNAEGAIRVAPKPYSPSLDLIPFSTGMTRAQFLSVTVGVGEGNEGKFTVQAMPANATVHLVIDVFGYHAP